MFKYQFRLFAIGAAATLAAVTRAAAQCCPALVSPCCAAPVVQPVVVAPLPVSPCCATPEMYVVNQGPVYSGPGPYVTQRNYIEGDQVAPVGYPYVGYLPSEPVYRHPFYRGPRFYRGPAFYRGPGFYRRWAGRRYIGRPVYGFRRPYVGRPAIRATIGPRPGRVLYR